MTRPKKAEDGAITKVDDKTVKLKLPAARHHVHPGHVATIRPRRAPRLREDRANISRTRSAPGRSNSSPTMSARRRCYKRRENGKWWGGEAYLDGVEFIDYGTDPSARVSAFEAGEVHTNYETVGRLCRHPRRARADEVRSRHRGDDRGAHERQQQAVRRPEGAQRAAAGGRQRDRSAARLRRAGTVAENHHVCPIHPEYVALPKKARDIGKAPRR